MRVPFDGVDFVLVALECPYGHVLAQSAHVDLHVCAARGERRVRLPVDVQRWRCVECELLLACACLRVPNYRRLIDASTKNVVAFFVPFERENGSFVLA